MSFHNVDVNSEFFTPQEFAVEILEIAKHQDVIPCCLNFSAKQFLAFMLFKEYYFLCVLQYIVCFIVENL